jgi:hypothetical protein
LAGCRRSSGRGSALRRPLGGCGDSFVQRTATVTERAPVQLRWSTTKVFELEPCPEFQQQPDERLHGPQSSSSQLLVPARSTRCSRWLILVVFMTGRSLAALQLSGFFNVRSCRCAVLRIGSLLLCAAVTSVTAFLAPVWQGAARLQESPSYQPSATFATHGCAPGERAVLGLLMWPIRVRWRLCATAGNMSCVASSCTPPAAGITQADH